MTAPRLLIALVLLPLALACSSCASVQPAPADTRIVIFHFNDIHGKIDNFAKVAAIVESERRKGGDVYLFCAGDNFTGNPIIDQYEPPGEPMRNCSTAWASTCSARQPRVRHRPGKPQNFAARAPPSFRPTSAPATAVSPAQAYVELQTKGGAHRRVRPDQIEAGNGLPRPIRPRQGAAFQRTAAESREMKSCAVATILLGLTHLGDQDRKLAEQMPELDAIGGHSARRPGRNHQRRAGGAGRRQPPGPGGTAGPQRRGRKKAS
jgi:hypothetical protein